MKSQDMPPAISTAPDNPEPVDPKKENRSVIDELLQKLKETKAAIAANWRYETDPAAVFLTFGG